MWSRLESPRVSCLYGGRDTPSLPLSACVPIFGGSPDGAASYRDEGKPELVLDEWNPSPCSSVDPSFLRCRIFLRRASIIEALDDRNSDENGMQLSFSAKQHYSVRTTKFLCQVREAACDQKQKIDSFIRIAMDKYPF